MNDLINLNIINNFQILTDNFNKQNIIEARTKEGIYYKNDIEKNEKILAAQGILVKETSNTYQVTLLKSEYDIKEVVNEIPEIQNVKGIVVTKSQATISNYINNSTFADKNRRESIYFQ